MATYLDIARPFVVQNADDNYPYSGVGSSFVVSTKNSDYWITAAHVVRVFRGDAESIRVFPTEQSRQSLPFNESYSINTVRGSDDEDFKDVYGLRINLNEFQRCGDTALVSSAVDTGFFNPLKLQGGARLAIVGYPSEKNYIDYANSKINIQRYIFDAHYLGESISAHCYQLMVKDSLSLESFDGLCGSPVFYFPKVDIAHQNQPSRDPHFVGMIIRGSPSSSLMQFISAQVIENLVTLAEST